MKYFTSFLLMLLLMSCKLPDQLARQQHGFTVNVYSSFTSRTEIPILLSLKDLICKEMTSKWSNDTLFQDVPDDIERYSFISHIEGVKMEGNLNFDSLTIKQKELTQYHILNCTGELNLRANFYWELKVGSTKYYFSCSNDTCACEAISQNNSPN